MWREYQNLMYLEAARRQQQHIKFSIKFKARNAFKRFGDDETESQRSEVRPGRQDRSGCRRQEDVRRMIQDRTYHTKLKCINRELYLWLVCKYQYWITISESDASH